jgi:hypothetical protein
MVGSKMINELKATTAAQLFRWISGVIIPIASVWLFLTPFITSCAGDASMDFLVNHGLDPANIVAMKAQGTANNTAINEVNTDVERVQSTINGLKQDMSTIGQSQKDTQDIVKQLLNMELTDRRNRTSVPQ